MNKNKEKLYIISSLIATLPLKEGEVGYTERVELKKKNDVLHRYVNATYPEPKKVPVPTEILDFRKQYYTECIEAIVKLATEYFEAENKQEDAAVLVVTDIQKQRGNTPAMLRLCNSLSPEYALITAKYIEGLIQGVTDLLDELRIKTMKTED